MGGAAGGVVGDSASVAADHDLARRLPQSVLHLRSVRPVTVRNGRRHEPRPHPQRPLQLPRPKRRGHGVRHLDVPDLLGCALFADLCHDEVRCLHADWSRGGAPVAHACCAGRPPAVGVAQPCAGVRGAVQFVAAARGVGPRSGWQLSAVRIPGCCGRSARSRRGDSRMPGRRYPIRGDCCSRPLRRGAVLRAERRDDRRPRAGCRCAAACTGGAAAVARPGGCHRDPLPGDGGGVAHRGCSGEPRLHGH